MAVLEREVVIEQNKKELFLDFNDFRKPKYSEDLMALVQLVINLIFLVPGTYPDSPSMGINIKDFQFERATSSKIGELEDLINSQIIKYIQSNQIQGVTLNMQTDKHTNYKYLAVTLNISKEIMNGKDFVTVIFFKNPTTTTIDYFII
jgi:hypothetical protein